MDRLIAIMWKEFIQIFRDKKTLRIIILMPIFQLVLYGYAITTDTKHMATAIYDEDRTSMSRLLVDAFEQSAYFDIDYRVGSEKAIQELLDRGKVKVALHIPPDFSKMLYSARSAQLQMLIDGTDSNPANTAVNTGNLIVMEFARRQGFIPPFVAPIEFRPRLWYNPDLKSSFFMVPGLIGLLLQILIPMVTATAIVREKERGNIEQLLVTPVKSYEVMVGKIIPYILIGMMIATFILAAAYFLFSIPIKGSLLFLFFCTFIFLLVCLGMGLFCSTIADTQFQATQLVMMLAPPSILLSGFIFAREAMPFPIFLLGYFIPLTYFLEIIRGIVLKGVGFKELWPHLVPLMALAIVVLLASITKFRKRLA